MVSMRLPTLFFRLAGTSCTTETIPTIRMALATIISSTEKPSCFSPALAKLPFAFNTCILLLRLHQSPRAAHGSLPNLGLPHRYNGDGSKPILRLDRISERQEIGSGRATRRIIHRAAVIKLNGVRKVLRAGHSGACRPRRQRLPVRKLHVIWQHHHWIAGIQYSIAFQVDIKNGVPALHRFTQADRSVAPYRRVSRSE